ncbi:hypothetical protein [Salipiger aestuarii]|uniref:hypothetical protein n=1 Tax=Salipiger aestuarii TaxID=568098 RepID=UPI00147664C4|nr:hypothetical protein [Salipiger aestuarii]
MRKDQMRLGPVPELAACDRIAGRARSGFAAIDAGQALSGQRGPKVGKKDSLQGHARLGRGQISAPKVLGEVGDRGASELIRAGDAGAMQQPHRFGLPIGAEGTVIGPFLKFGKRLAVHVLGHRLRTRPGHRHHMGECTRDNELQRNKNDEETTDHRVSFRPGLISTGAR